MNAMLLSLKATVALDYIVSKSIVTQLPIRNLVVHPNVKVAKDLCNMTLLNQQKVKKMRRMRNLRATNHLNAQYNSSELIDVH